jgi:glycosyltransferase involved in cell wall biosynthesis
MITRSMDNLDGRKLLLISTSSGSRGGGEIYLLRLANALASSGCTVNVVLSTNRRMDELAEQFDERIVVLRKPFLNTYDRRLRFLSELYDRAEHEHLQQYLAGIQPDLVHLNKQNLEDGLGWMNAIHKSGSASVTTVHVPNSMQQLRARFGRFRDACLRPQFLKVSTHFVCVSEASRRQFESFLGRPPLAPVTVIPNGVPQAPAADPSVYRLEWQIPDEAFILGTIARIEFQKNPLFAVELLARLPERFHVVWVGDGRLRASMERLASQKGVKSRLHIDGWKNDARSRLSAFDAFFLPSRFEGFPLAILEAMAAGVPCVVSDVDGNVESVRHEETGLVLPLDDLPAWGQAVAGLAVDERMRDRYAEAGRRRYEEHYSVESMTRQTVNLYRKALGLKVSA